MGFFISAMLSSEGGHICMRPQVEGKCALPREDNIAFMKNQCNFLYNVYRLSSF